MRYMSCMRQGNHVIKAGKPHLTDKDLEKNKDYYIERKATASTYKDVRANYYHVRKQRP